MARRPDDGVITPFRRVKRKASTAEHLNKRHHDIAVTDMNGFRGETGRVWTRDAGPRALAHIDTPRRPRASKP
ncbi:hypothetical protein [Caulobacter sp.]|uniref:hypothetical protein n=1 Tax=Caulobacter sp. TaxID=78 RepID=UPI001B11BF8C|nr:hypothetical protein [Caulobacter sp.]MBO9546983.1 hypothetical protein [Caulobacter sp.]